MINPLALKVGLGGAVVTGAGATGTIYREEIKDFFKKQFSKKNSSNSENENHEQNDSKTSVPPEQSTPSQASPTEQKEEQATATQTNTETQKTETPVTTESSGEAQVDTASNSGTASEITTTTTVNTTTTTPAVTTTSVSNYIIVKTTVEPETGITKDLYEESSDTRNFKCTVDNNEDTECDIFLISDTAADNKLNNLNNIDISNTKTKQENIKTNNFFKLKIKDSVFGTEGWNETKTVDLVSTDNTSGSKKYGTFSLNYKITKVNNVFSVQGKTDWIIAKMTSEKSTETISDVTNLNCSTKDATPDDQATCSIFKIDGTFNNLSEIKTTDIKDEVSSENDFSKDKYFVIDLKKNNQKNVSDFTDKTIILATSSDSKQIGEFLFQSALLKDLSGNFSSSSKKILLS